MFIRLIDYTKNMGWGEKPTRNVHLNFIMLLFQIHLFMNFSTRTFTAVHGRWTRLYNVKKHTGLNVNIF